MQERGLRYVEGRHPRNISILLVLLLRSRDRKDAQMHGSGSSFVCASQECHIHHVILEDLDFVDGQR